MPAVQKTPKRFVKTFEGGDLLPLQTTNVTVPAATVVSGNLRIAVAGSTASGHSAVHLNSLHPWEVADLRAVEFLVRLQTGSTSGTKFVVGAASAVNADPDSVANHAWFLIDSDGKVIWNRTTVPSTTMMRRRTRPSPLGRPTGVDCESTLARA